MNGFVIFFIVMYAINLVVGLIQIGLGSKLLPSSTHGSAGIVKVLSVCIGLPLFLAAVGVI